MDSQQGDTFTKQQQKKLNLNQRITQIVDATGNYSQTYPFYMYRKGKYITKEEQRVRSVQEYISRSIYDKCFEENVRRKNIGQSREDDVVQCYKSKVAIFRDILEVAKKVK